MSGAAGGRPLVVVGHGYRSVPPLQLARAASDVCDLLWVVDSADPEIVAVAPLLSRIGGVVDTHGLSAEEIAAAVGVHGPQGVLAYRDDDLLMLADVAALLDLSFHTPEVARRLADKLVQRDALRRSGISVPRVWELESSHDTTAVDEVAEAVRYPVVVKPRQGSGSWHTFLAADPAALVGGLLDLRRGGSEPEAMVVEEYLPSMAGAEGAAFADYVSVESIVCAGVPVHVAVTGRTPLAHPFRETGFCIPAPLAAPETDAVLAEAGVVLQALEIVTGCVHTEIKLTPDGPRVIEVNGRVGGGVPEMLALAAGVDLYQISMRAALGEAPAIDGPVACQRVGYRFFFQPPPSARRVVSVEGLDRVGALPGVESVSLNRGPGRDVDATQGTRAYIFSVVGSTADHEGVLEADRAIHAAAEVTYEPLTARAGADSIGANQIDTDTIATTRLGTIEPLGRRHRDHGERGVGHADPIRTVG